MTHTEKLTTDSTHDVFSKNEDQPLVHYRENALKAPRIPKNPINLGPAKRIGQLGLVVAPWLWPLTLIHFGWTNVVVIWTIYFLVSMLPNLFLAGNYFDEHRNDNDFKKIIVAIRFSWWPIFFLIWGSKGIVYGSKFLAQASVQGYRWIWTGRFG